MKIIPYDDGSRSLIYEPGDRVTIVKETDAVFGKVGEKATVIRRDYAEKGRELIAFLHIQTDAMKECGWGTIHVAPWELEPYEPTSIQKTA